MLARFNSEEILEAVHLAWQETVEEVEAANRTAIQSWRYEWPRSTYRQNGEVVGSPRDIVDTGRLLESQYVQRKSSETFELGWGVDYASEVHEGKTLKSGAHLPARRWTQEAIRGDGTAPGAWQNPRAVLDVPTYFAEQFRGIYGGG
jgi:hypothetical protein